MWEDVKDKVRIESEGNIIRKGKVVENKLLNGIDTKL